MSIEYGPSDPKGREFKGEGFIWILLFDLNKSLYGKVNKESLESALRKEPFELWHPMMPTPQGMAYLSAGTKTIEPWIMVASSIICNIHPTEGEQFDKMVKQLVSGIVIATPGDLPKTPPKKFSLTE